MLSRTSIAALAVSTVVTFAVAALAARTLSFVGRPVAGAAFAHVDGSGPEWQFEGSAGVEKQVSVPLPVRSGTLLWIRLDLDKITGDVAPVIVDLVGPGYDNDEQEFHLAVGPRDQGASFSRLIFTDLVPEPRSTRMRVFEYSGARLSIARLSVTSLHLGFLLPFLVSALLLAFVLVRRMIPGAVWMAAWEAARARGRAASRDPEILLPALVALIVCCLVGIVVVLPYPLLASDEYLYAFRSKYGWSAYAGEPGIIALPMPNLVYFRLFHWVHTFGGNELALARAFNTVLFGLAAFPIYWLFRRYTAPGMSALLALLFCAGPTSSYAAYFMPEATYFLGFWCVILLFVRMLEQESIPRVLATAAALAVLALVKPHAIALLISLCFVLLLLPLFQPGRPLRRTLRTFALLVPGWYLTWLLFASALGHRLLLNPVGEAYGTAAGKVLGAQNLTALASALAIVLGRHLAIVVLIFGVPLSLVVAKLGRALLRRREGAQGLDIPLALTSIVVPGALMLMSSKLTVEVAGMDAFETIDRLHGRYYSFALPLIALAAAAARPLLDEPARLLRWLWVAASLVVLAGALFISGGIPWQHVGDYPEAFVLHTMHPLVELAAVAALAAAVAALFAPRWVWRVFAGWLTIFSLLGAHYVFAGDQERGAGIDEDRLGVALRAMLTPDERDQTVIFSRKIDVRSYYLGLELSSRAQFRGATDLSAGHCAVIPDSARYLVTLDPIPVDCGYHPLLRIGGTQLYQHGP